MTSLDKKLRKERSKITSKLEIVDAPHTVKSLLSQIIKMFNYLNNKEASENFKEHEFYRKYRIHIEYNDKQFLYSMYSNYPFYVIDLDTLKTKTNRLDLYGKLEITSSNITLSDIELLYEKLKTACKEELQKDIINELVNKSFDRLINTL